MSNITKIPGTAVEANMLNAKVGRSYLSPIERVITVDGKRLISQDIQKWKRALDAARSNTNPRRDRLYELYDSIILDGHLESVMEKFLSKVLNKKVLFTPKHGFEGMDTQALDEWVLDTPWFRDIIRYRMQAVIWGHSLVELVPEGGVIDRVTLIDRRNVVPERGFMAYSYYNLEGDGIYYLEDKKWNKYMLDFGGRLNYGKLMTAAQYVIYKRGDIGDWAQFNELFGMPFREFHYNPYNPGDREKLEQAAKETGGAGYVVLPDGSKVTFHSNNSTGAVDTYEKLAAFCNAELSKLFLGNTLTTESGDKGARSLGEVHGSEQDDLMLTHIIETEHDLNWTVKDKLRDLGYPDLEKGNFRFHMGTEMPLDKRILIDIQVSNRVPIPEEYWYETYGIPRPDAATAAKDVKPEPPTQDPQPDGQEKGGQAPNTKPAPKVTATITAKCCGGLHDAVAADVPRIAAVYVPDEDEERLMQQLFDGVAGKYDLPTFQANARRLVDAAMGGLNPSFDYDAPDTEAALGFQMNIQRFAFQKNLAQTIELNRVMKASQSYEEFRQQAAVILGTFNDAYLRAEFNLARTVGQTTRDWLNIQANAEVMPYVRYKTVGDANVRPAHAALDNRVFSVADRSFAQFNPPNGYGCRCWLEPVSSPGRDRVTTGEEGENLMGVEYGKMKDGGFAINRADTKAIFNLAEDYAQVLQGADTSIDNLTWADAKRESFTVARGRIGQAMPEERLTATEEMQWGKFPVRGSETMSRAAMEAITKPTEVYMTSDSLRFIRMYSDQMAVAIVDYQDGKLNYRSELFSADDSVRKGLLIQ
jgi:SPP1 gp7 family putative phage head morphogenesis protein